MDDEERRLGRALNLEEEDGRGAMLKTVVTSEGGSTQGSGVEGDGLPVPGHPGQGGSEIIKKFHEKYGRVPASPKSCGTGSRRCALAGGHAA